MNIETGWIAEVFREARTRIPEPGREASSVHRAYSEGRRAEREALARSLASAFERRHTGLSYADFLAACGVTR